MTTDMDGDLKLLDIFQHLSVQDQREVKESRNGSHGGLCAICLETIVLEETAMVKGCEHAYCVTCILRWATYSEKPTCPQCKHPFDFLNIHRSLDGNIHDYMFEESVCLLLRAAWFIPLIVEDQEDLGYDEYFYPYEVNEDDLNEDDLDEVYYQSSSSIRIGNRRWGPNGYISAGHQEARPVNRPNAQNRGASSSRVSRNSETKKDANGHAQNSGASSSHDSDAKKDMMGRRAKRAMKREAADKAAAAKHERHLARLGRK